MIKVRLALRRDSEAPRLRRGQKLGHPNRQDRKVREDHVAHPKGSRDLAETPFGSHSEPKHSGSFHRAPATSRIPNAWRSDAGQSRQTLGMMPPYRQGSDRR